MYSCTPQSIGHLTIFIQNFISDCLFTIESIKNAAQVFEQEPHQRHQDKTYKSAGYK